MCAGKTTHAGWVVAFHVRDVDSTPEVIKGTNNVVPAWGIGIVTQSALSSPEQLEPRNRDDGITPASTAVLPLALPSLLLGMISRWVGGVYDRFTIADFAERGTGLVGRAKSAADALPNHGVLWRKTLTRSD